MELNREFAAVWFSKGDNFGQLGKYQEAVESYDKGLKIDPNDAARWYNRGHSLRKLEKYQEALESYDKAVKLDPNLEPALKAKKEVLKCI